MRIGVLLFFSFILAGASSVAVAEGGCPPGQYPQNGQGFQNCVPIPGYQNQNQLQRPQVLWQDRWGALASDSDDHVAGASKNSPSEADAVNAAIADCKSYGGKGCRQAAVYRNQCVAVVSGDTRSDTYMSTTLEAAKDKGMATCSSQNQTNCHVFYSGCSLPVRVQ